jgi:hypothetical protein
MRVCHGSIRRYYGLGSFATPTLDVHSHRVLADVSVSPFDVHGHGSRSATQSLRSYAGLIDLIQEFSLQLGHVWIRVSRTDPTKSASLLGQLHRYIGRTS